MSDTDEKKEDGPRSVRRGEFRVAVILICCVGLVIFWEVMSNRSERPLGPFAITAQDFNDFQPELAEWRVERLPVTPDPIEPNILVYLLTPRNGGGYPILVRLVHGYNMVDCMREKGETVELLHDTRRELGEAPAAGSDGRQYQVWRLQSSTGRVAIWVTSMLQVGSFQETGLDTRDMPFPGIGIPDNPGWFPRGLSWKSLRHPIRNGRLFLRAKWNASRTDVMTFLKLRQPAYVSDEVLTLVANSMKPQVSPGEEADVGATVLRAQGAVLRELMEWRAQTEE